MLKRKILTCLLFFVCYSGFSLNFKNTEKVQLEKSNYLIFDNCTTTVKTTTESSDIETCTTTTTTTVCIQPAGNGTVSICRVTKCTPIM